MVEHTLQVEYIFLLLQKDNILSQVECCVGSEPLQKCYHMTSSGMGPFSHVTLALNLYFSTFRYFPCTASLQCCHTLNTRKVLSQVPNRTGPTSISKSLTYLFHQWVSINYWRRKMLTLCNCLEVPCEMNSTCYSVWSCLPRCKVGVTSSNFHFP